MMVGNHFMRRFILKLRRATGSPPSVSEAAPVKTRTNLPDKGTPEDLSKKFSREMLASLILELPEHREALSRAYHKHDREGLADGAHKLLGAVAYCNLPELNASLRNLRQATIAGEPSLTRQYHQQALLAIDDILSQCDPENG